MLFILILIFPLAISFKYYIAPPWEKCFTRIKLPEGKYLSNVRQLSNFIGAKNLHFSLQDSQKLYFESNIVFYDTKYGCNQFYSLEHEQIPPERISVGHGDVENVLFINSEEKLALISSNNKIMDKFLNYSSLAKGMDTDLLILPTNDECKQAKSPLIEYLYENCRISREWKDSKKELESICNFWWNKELIYDSFERFIMLNPNKDIYLYDFVTQLPLKKFISNTNFDGYHCLSKDGKTIYYISIDSKISQIPQIWSMDVENGENKQQLTSSNDWKVGPLKRSPNGNNLVFMCIPGGNGIHEELQHLLSNQPATFNASATRICTIGLENGPNNVIFKIVELSSPKEILPDISVLYQFANPIFFSDQKIIFSARKFLGIESKMDLVKIDYYSNMALFISNLDGSDTEQIVDYRAMNDFPFYDFVSGRFTWISSNGKHSKQRYIYMAQFTNITDILKESAKLQFEIRNVKQLTNYGNNQFATRPIFSADHESILFELIKFKSSMNSSNNINEKMISEIRRIPMPTINFQQNCEDLIEKNELYEFSFSIQQKSLLISSAFEFALNVVSYDSEGSFILYSIGSSLLKKNKKIVENAIKWRKQKNSSILELRNYLKENLQSNVYKSNALGQILYPLVETNEEFSTIIEEVAHIKNDSICQLLFITINSKKNYELWSILSKNCWNVYDETFCYTTQNSRCSKWDNWKTMKDGGNLPMNKIQKLLNLENFNYIGDLAFSLDGQKIVFAGSIQQNEQEISPEDNVMNFELPKELFIMNWNGTELKQLTNFKAQSFGPKFLPIPFNNFIIFNSNYANNCSTNYSLYIYDLNSKNLEKIQISMGTNSSTIFADVISTKKSPTQMAIVWSGKGGKEYCADSPLCNEQYDIFFGTLTIDIKNNI